MPALPVDLGHKLSSSFGEHLTGRRVLRTAKLVRSRVAAQQRIYELDTEGLAEIESWLDGVGPLWQKRLEALQRERRLETRGRP